MSSEVLMPFWLGRHYELLCVVAFLQSQLGHVTQPKCSRSGIYLIEDASMEVLKHTTDCS